ncbi:MAG: hypothetical protein PHC99_05375 [Methylococcales bacterium]|nr:hypothetical protein [Methylococcales bacterium]
MGLLAVAFLCFVDNGAGGWNTTQVSVATDCTGFVAQAAGSYSDLGLGLLFKTYFEFDPAIFSMIVLWNMVAFVSGYSIRRVVRLLAIL